MNEYYIIFSVMSFSLFDFNLYGLIFAFSNKKYE